ncbi:hypothetical protein F5Y08DRAFT_341490 [Xylaria arbuscula]|nr:hypothetical protein F5Y08DRAFT_341490 [Xylaria arbuscula]
MHTIEWNEPFPPNPDPELQFAFLGPRRTVRLRHADWGIDLVAPRRHLLRRVRYIKLLFYVLHGLVATRMGQLRVARYHRNQSIYRQLIIGTRIRVIESYADVVFDELFVLCEMWDISLTMCTAYIPHWNTLGRG